MQIHEIKSQLSQLGSGHIPESRIAYALRSPGVDGDVTKTIELVILFEDTISGVIKPFNPQVKMVGAVNREKTTCYLDASLFAMFSKTTVFEAMIYHDFSEKPRRKLVLLLRLWVNMLRTGHLITTDITRKLQEALAECGWPEAARIRQQDASEAFGFITDKLELPLLTLKTDLFHQGKYDKDDHKFITERLLDVGIPEDVPEDAAVPLEKCLEEYFNNKVEVKRQAHRRNTVTDAMKNDAVKELDEKEAVAHIETAEVESRAETPRPSDTPTWPSPPRPLTAQDRTTSIFSERRVETFENVDTNDNQPQDKARPTLSATMRKASVRKEVAMPAWQFLNLIPWYTDNESEADTQMKAHFASRRPMLGICLKRYKISNKGAATRLDTQIDIPLEMAPPHFAVDDHNQADESANPNLKLVLQAVVCHRGQHVTSGHYIAFVRTVHGDPHGSFSDVTGVSDPDTSRDLWLRHDDLATNHRIASVDIKAALKAESPYLLFYQVLPVDESNFPEDPPPYQESTSSFSATIGEKLAGLQAQSRPSLDPPEINSRRVSIAVSDDLRSPASNQGLPLPVQNHSDSRVPSVVRQDSGNMTDSQRTRPTTPHDGLQSTTQAEPKHTKTKSARSSNDVSKKMGEFVSRLGGGGSREKINSQEVVVQVNDDSSETSVTKEAETKTEKPPDQLVPPAKGRPKEKDKKLKSKSKSRRSSVPLGKLPERECRVM